MKNELHSKLANEYIPEPLALARIRTAHQISAVLFEQGILPRAVHLAQLQYRDD